MGNEVLGRFRVLEKSKERLLVAWFSYGRFRPLAGFLTQAFSVARLKLFGNAFWACSQLMEDEVSLKDERFE
jgi:hypothetical protein